jgi:hypothetical protein
VGGTPPPQNSFQEYDLAAPSPFRTAPLPPAISQAHITDPNTVLTDMIAHQTILETTVLQVTSPGIGVAQALPGGAQNIPFLVDNACTAQVTATFWIEKVQRRSGRQHFMQLQYSQTVLLNFLGLSWPHVTVATLIRN